MKVALSAIKSLVVKETFTKAVFKRFRIKFFQI